MLIIIISRSGLKLGHVGSKTRSLGQQATQVSDLGPPWPSCFYKVTTKIFLKDLLQYGILSKFNFQIRKPAISKLTLTQNIGL